MQTAISPVGNRLKYGDNSSIFKGLSNPFLNQDTSAQAYTLTSALNQKL